MHPTNRTVPSPTHLRIHQGLPTLYWKIEVESEPLQTLWKTLQADSKYQLQFSFHITLAFLGAESSMHWTVLLQDWYMEVDMGK